jgi:protein-disulfide isomerase
MIAMRILKCSAVLLLAASLFAQTAPTKPAPQPAAEAAPAALPPGAPTAALVDACFKRMFGYDQDLQFKVLDISLSSIPELFDVTVLFTSPQGQQLSHWYVSRDLKHAIPGEIFPFGADPFAPERAELAKSAFGATKGPANAKLLIVEFADLECPACREAAPIMEKIRNDFPQARFVFQSFPLTHLHPWAQRASAFLDCIARTTPDHAFTFIEAIYGHQREIEAAVRKTAPDGKPIIDEAAVTEQLRHYTEWAGANPAAIESCAATPETARRLVRSEQIARSLGVTSTPTLFINGRRVGSPSAAQYEALKTVISYEADMADTGR